MKLTILLMTLALMNVYADSRSQTVSYSGKNVPLKNVCNVIEKQTRYLFLFSESALKTAKPVTLSVSNVQLDKVLSEIFKSQPLEYSVKGKTIFVTVRQANTNIPPDKGIADLPPPIDVRGKVQNENGEPVSGVSVMVKGTKRGTTSNAKGEFELRNVDENATLVLSGVNVETKEIKVGGRSDLATITVSTHVASNEEVVVVASSGFQKISRERSTGSYGVVSKDQLEKPTTNIAQRLIGTMSGIQARSMDVDGNPTFEIRGKSSLSANPTPLIVVDGFPVQGDFNSINPNDVESVTVLKDAAAASVWGARSANGVIVITTKRAKKGTPLRVEFNAFTSIGAKFDLDYVRPLASSAETVEYEKLTYNYWRTLADPNALTDIFNAYGTASILMNEAKLGYITTAQRDAGLGALKNMDNRQQIKDHLLAHPTTTQYNLSLLGGSERMSNNVSLMYEQNQSNFKETDNKRFLVNFRNNSDITKWLGLNLNANYLYSKSNNNGVSLSDIQGMAPYEMLLNPDGSFTNIQQLYTPILERMVPVDKFPYSDWTYNPVREIASRNRTNEQSQARLQAALNFKIMRGLSAEILGQYELVNGFTRNIADENSFEVRRAVNVATSWDRTVTPDKFTLNLPKGSIMSQSRSRVSSYNVRGQINFDRVFAGKHEINFVSGTEFQNVVAQTYTNPTTYGYNDATLGVGTFPNGPGGTFFPIRNFLGQSQTFSYVNSFGYTTRRLYSAYANAAYTYNEKYTVSGSYRVDASNLIAEDPSIRYDPFYSMGAAWHLYRENFMKNVNWVDRLTARITYGRTGNYDENTAVKPLITPSAASNIYINDFTATFSSFGNPTLRWEKTDQWNFALDFSLFKNKLYGKIDLYNKRGRDLIATLSIPGIYGTTTQRLNNAAMTNKGIDLELGTLMTITKDLKWRGNISFSYNDNKITDLFVVNYNAFQMAAGGSSAYVVGENANSLWRYRYAGVVNGIPAVSGLGDSKIDYYSGVAPGNAVEFMQNMGPSVAPYTFNLMSSFQYKGLDLSFIITSKFGHVFQRMGFNYPSLFSGRVLPNSKLSEVMNGDPSKIAPLPPQVAGSDYYLWGDRMGPKVDYLIENASHLRMQEINLTYTLPARITQKIGFNRLRVYAQGNNLFTIYANNVGEDPEYPLGTMRPMPRYTFGIRFDF